MTMRVRKQTRANSEYLAQISLHRVFHRAGMRFYVASSHRPIRKKTVHISEWSYPNPKYIFQYKARNKGIYSATLASFCATRSMSFTFKESSCILVKPELAVRAIPDYTDP